MNANDPHINMKEAYTDGSKSTGRKLEIAAVFTDIPRRGTLPNSNERDKEWEMRWDG